jgi:ABC-type glycerol-3-phosphate transport system permease component
VFCLLQLVVFLKGIRSWLNERQYQYVIGTLIVAGIGLVIAVVLLAMSGYVPALTGRFKSLLGMKLVSESFHSSLFRFYLKHCNREVRF